MTRTYGDDGEMTGVTDFGGRNFAFAYDQDMNPTNTAYPNGVSSANAYDNAGRLTSITDTKGPATLASFNYGRSVGGDVTGETSGGTSAGSNKTYAYNTLGQLASENGGNFTYDSADNLTKKADGTLMTYDVANEVQTKTPSSGPATTYAYDTKGNRTGSVTNNVTTNANYDQANRMTSYGPSATYNYDGGGLRTSKTVSGTTANFTYDTADGLPLIIDDGTSAYVYGPGGVVLEQINGSTPTYLHHDQLGSTRLLTDSSGAAVGTYQFDAYGNATSHTGTATSPMQYAGQYLDSESGLYWMRARYYDSGTGQFTSRDPLVSITGEAYSYAGGDPVDGQDPSGLFCLLGSHADGTCKHGFHNVVGQFTQGVEGIGEGVAAHPGAAIAVVGVAVGVTACVAGGCEALAAAWGGSRIAGAVAESGCAEEGMAVSRAGAAGEEWLGSDARMITNGAGDRVFISADKARRIRFDLNNPAPHLNPHAHVEELIDGVWNKSGPIFPTDVPPF